MQNSYSETIRQLENAKIVISKFNFDCQLCGLCCSEFQEVWLEPYDIFRLSRFAFKTQIPTSELFKQGFLEISIDKTKNLPFCKIRFDENKLCPFLEKITNGKFACKLHKTNAKPFVCKLSPIARSFDENFSETYFLVAPDENCFGMRSREEQNLSTWLKTLSDKKNLFFSKEFYQFLDKIQPNLNENQVLELGERLYNFDSFGLFKTFEGVWERIKNF